MKLLKKDCFQEARKSIYKYARPLERVLFELHFEGASADGIIKELKEFQNEDGGFGHGIESDFRLPLSSPMATSVGIRLLSRLDYHQEAQRMISKAIGYLEADYNPERRGWFTVPKEVNDFPHAFWWHFNEAEGMTIIDYSWGNPSAELIAYCYKYRSHLKKLDADMLVEYAIAQIEEKREFKSEFEIFCYIKLYEVLPEGLKKKLEERIRAAVSQLIVYDEESWHEYLPKPVDFVSKAKATDFGVDGEKLQKNLDYIIQQLEQESKIVPPWGEEHYTGDLKAAYNEWIGELTLKALLILKGFNRLDI